jgi:hypothetical protein
LHWIANHDPQWLLWAYEEEVFQTYGNLQDKKEASEFRQGRSLFQQERSIRKKIKGLWRYSLDLDPDMKNRAEGQLQKAVKLLSNVTKKQLRTEEEHLLYQYLLTYVLSLTRDRLLYPIGNDGYRWEDFLEMLGIQKSGKYPAKSTLESAYKKVHSDLNNYRAFTIDGQNLSKAKGRDLLETMIEDKDRERVPVEQRTLRSLKDTLRRHDVPRWVLKRLKWKNGKAFITFAPEKLIFTKK